MVELENIDLLIQSLRLMAEKNIDFTDAYLVELGKNLNKSIITFDKRINKIIKNE